MSPTGFPFFRSAVAAELDSIHRLWGWLLGLGIVLIAVGVAAIVYPVTATVATIKVFGILLLVAAVGEFVAAFFARGWSGVLTAVLCGILYLFAGVVLLERPLLGAAVYTLFLTMMFFALGIVRIVAALIHRFSGWGWAVVSGVISVALAVLLWQSFPESALWVIGMFVGIDLIFAGWSWVMLGLAARQLPTTALAPTPAPVT